ncbi:MAG TPA: hypothetical protein VGC91_09960 [Pyrinomonadaceae bacterium]|jgi:hypothetical protein
MLRRIFFSFAFILLAQTSLRAQQSSSALPAQCPSVSVDCPTGIVPLDQPMTFQATISGGDTSVKLTFTWSTSGCKIIDGQGTPTITVGEFQPGAAYTATVHVGGFSEECRTTASCTLAIDHAPLSHIFDEYGSLAFRDEKARLSNFAIELDNNPGAQGYIIAYAGRRRRNRTRRHLHRVKDYLIKRHEIDDGRVVTIDGGYRDKSSVELWIVPTGAEPPKPKPS